MADIPPDERRFEEILVDYNEELGNLIGDSTILESQFSVHETTISELAEDYKDLKNVGITEQELFDSENLILPDFERLQAIQNTHKTMIERLADRQRNLVRFWRSFDVREAELRNDERSCRQEIENTQLESQISRTNEGNSFLENELLANSHQAKIKSVEGRVREIQACQESLREMRSDYNEVMENVERVKKAQEAIFEKLLTVIPLVERNLTAIKDLRTEKQQ